MLLNNQNKWMDERYKHGYFSVKYNLYFPHLCPWQYVPYPSSGILSIYNSFPPFLCVNYCNLNEDVC